MYRGGSISNYQDANSLTTKDMKEIHIDKRVLPLLNDEVTENISIDQKYYQNIPPAQAIQSSNLTATQTVNFNVNASSDSLISLSESYFRLNLTITQAADIPVAGGGPTGPASANFALMPHADDFFFDNLTTRINNTDVSDQHTQGLYGVSAFHKKILTKPRERLAVGRIIPVNTAKTGGNDYVEQTPVDNDVSSSNDLACIGYSYDTTDSVMVNPGQEIFSKLSGGASAEVYDGTGSWLGNHNAVYMKNLCTTYNIDGGYSPDTGLPPVGGIDTYIELMIFPKDGIWRTTNYLPSNVQLDIQCQIAQLYKWFMIATTDPLSLPTITVTNFSLMLCRVKPNPDVMASINKVLLDTNKFSYKLLNSRTQQVIIPKQTGAGQVSFSSVLSGIVPNVVLLSFISQGAFDKVYSTPAAFADAAAWLLNTCKNHWLDCHTMSSGLYRKVNADDNPLTGGIGTDDGIPKISSIYIEAGAKRIPLNQIGYTNYNVGIENQVSMKQSYDAYRKQCVDYDKPWLSFEHWLGQFTVFAFNLTNNDNALACATDETQTGSLSIYVNFSDKTIAQYMMVTGLYYSEVDINASRSVTRVGY